MRSMQTTSNPKLPAIELSRQSSEPGQSRVDLLQSVVGAGSKKGHLVEGSGKQRSSSLLLSLHCTSDVKSKVDNTRIHWKKQASLHAPNNSSETGQHAVMSASNGDYACMAKDQISSEHAISFSHRLSSLNKKISIYKERTVPKKGKIIAISKIGRQFTLFTRKQS